MNPYRVLQCRVESGDQKIREAYLKMITRYSPDKDPKRFQFVSEAYEKIKDAKSRREYELFNNDHEYNSPIGVILPEVEFYHRRKPLAVSKMKEMFRACTKI